MKIHQIYVKNSPLNPYVDKSYFYILENDKQEAIAFDPGLFQPIDETLVKYSLKLKAILNTHHHPDHVGGNIELQKKYKCPIYCSEYDSQRVPGSTHSLHVNTTLKLINADIQIIDLKAHTLGLIGYYIKDLSALFPGDAIFSGGCGRLFEGTPKQLLASMETISKLPNDTKIYCSHEYTLQNLKFAQSINKNNPDLNNYLKKTQITVSEQRATVPSTVELELKINPFLQVLDPVFLKSTGEKNSEIAIKKIREQKDQFKG